MCGVALGGLTTWVAFDKAGSPAGIEVDSGSVFLPYGDSRDTAAFFRISNSGGADDCLIGVERFLAFAGVAATLLCYRRLAM
ncbi:MULTISPECIES: hypothetical protein [unclassified Streptomyces]|uniref:hypothetical protein n=1 Tax=unclassified Streptomyces TaxID=2593676 RepID=UPI00081E9E5C|nr:hypothetical protein GA0115259_1024016 [Streptomyces sp. MnatMP-M17]